MITKDMTIGQALKLSPKTAPIFLSYGMHCLGCPSATGESIAQAAEVHGIDLEKMLQDLNKAIEE